MSAFLNINGIHHAYGKTRVLENCSFSAKQGELVALLGESGSGKTTLLRLIAGFERPSSGSIVLNENILVDRNHFVVPEKRRVGMVFQDYALFPHLTVNQNIAIGKSAADSLSIDDWLNLVGLDGLGQRKPHELSGGQQQRVAIARSLAAAPEILLLDEPFSNIDESLKFGFRMELRSILRKVGMNAIFVTHDTKDALAVADSIVVLKDGCIRQAGTPQEIYAQPADTYVAGLMGPCSSLGKVDGKSVVIRAEHLCIVHPSQKTENTITGTVEHVLYQGGHYLVGVQTDAHLLLARSNEAPELGSTVALGYEQQHLMVLHER